MTHAPKPGHRVSTRAIVPLAIGFAVLLAAFIAACGGSSSKVPESVLPATTSVQINMGDAPADWLLSFSMKVSSMSLTHTQMGAVSVGKNGAPVEMISRLGTMEPVAVADVPQGSYSGATLTIASCTYSYLDPLTKQLQTRTIDGPINASVPFSSNVTVGSTPLAFNFDLDLLHSLSGDTGSPFQFAPKFHFSTATQDTAGSGGGNGVNARNGGMYQLMGVISSIAGTDTFVVQSVQSMNTYTFRVNTQTRFQGKVENMAQLANGMGVLVTAVAQSDGKFLATRIRAGIGAGGAMGGGVITEVIGMPATQLTIVMQNAAGASINTDYLSKTLTVNLTENTKYEIDDDRVDLTGLDFEPVFDASNIFAGQSVLPMSDEGIVANESCDPTCGTITASTLRLRERGFRGTTTVDLAPGAATHFTLTLPDGCAFTTLTGATEILVYQQPSTSLEDNQVITAGTTLRVHGLAFKVGTQWIMVASTISAV